MFGSVWNRVKHAKQCNAFYSLKRERMYNMRKNIIDSYLVNFLRSPVKKEQPTTI